MIKKKILIATGGTGGHVFPAYSLAEHFKRNNYIVKLTTDRKGLNYLKKYKNLNLTKISSSPLIKGNIFKFFFSIIIIFFSITKSLILLLFDRPSIVFGMGGYASFPICIAAKILKIDFVIYESNLIIGKANKYLTPFAEKIFVSWKDVENISEKYKDKIFVIGNIVREEMIIRKVEKNKTDSFKNLKILVLGGSQAAKVFAEKLPLIFEKIKKSEIPIQIYQQCRKQQTGQLLEFYKKANIDCEVFNFTHKIIDYYSKANLVITRSGASVLGELINFKIPFISIPLPASAEDHQYKNAIYYKKKGFGYLIEEKDINEQLYDIIKSLFKDKSLIKSIIENQRQYSDKNIFKDINIQIEKIINEKN